MYRAYQRLSSAIMCGHALRRLGRAGAAEHHDLAVELERAYAAALAPPSLWRVVPRLPRAMIDRWASDECRAVAPHREP